MSRHLTYYGIFIARTGPGTGPVRAPPVTPAACPRSITGTGETDAGSRDTMGGP
jgi:hypothetical protein